MKTAVVFAILAVGLASAFLLPPVDPNACLNPDLLNSPFCGFIPEGCLKPVCAGNALAPPSWFKSSCHLASYNVQCRGRYRKTFDVACDPTLRPPASSMPCPSLLP